MLKSLLNEKKRDISDNNIFLDNNNIIQADRMFCHCCSLFDFGLALMVNSKRKHLGKMEIGKGGIIGFKFCFVMSLITAKFKLVSSHVSVQCSGLC